VAYGVDAIAKVEENIAIVRSHFDVNRSDALRISLHLLAKAIKERKFMPGVK
jgi:hypothetical protein